MCEDITILFQDQDVVAISKPTGMLCHRGPECRDNSDRYVLQTMRDRLFRHLHIVHRLDRGTSGVMLLAYSKEVAGILSKQFEDHQVQKTYLAITRGWVASEVWVDEPLTVSRYTRNPRREVHKITRTREALSKFSCLCRSELPIPMSGFSTSRYSLVCAQPFSGRNHQIRRHLNHISHPILGDTVHGDRNYNEMLAREFGNERLLLHAWKLCFQHPRTRDELELIAPIPDSFSRIAAVLHLQLPQSPREKS